MRSSYAWEDDKKKRKYAVKLIIIIIYFIKKSVTEYYRMPPIYQLDDYDKCMSGQLHPEKEGVYCYTRTLIQPNKSAEIWKIVDVS